MPNKAFFLDRDGTINIDYDFVHTPDKWEFCDGAVEAIRWMNANNFKVIVVTNQSGIARGHFTLETVLRLHKWVDQELAKSSARIDGWYIAPWHPDFHDGRDPGLLKLRKPDTGMFLQAAKDHDIDFLQSYMAGDKLSDVKPALDLDIQSFLIKSRFTEKWDWDWIRENDIPVYDNLGEIVQLIETSKF